MSFRNKPDADRQEPERVVWLTTYCPTCGQPVAIHYERTVKHQREWWACPYASCDHTERLELRGRIVRVARYETPKT